MTAEELDSLLQASWSLLADGAARRKSPAHTPIVATIDDEGRPSQRVMVLRHADRAHRQLRLHTDARSPKVSQIASRPEISVLAYHPADAIQLRLQGLGSVETEGTASNAAWQQSTLFARRCYLSGQPPGSPTQSPSSGLPDWIEGKMPTEAQIGPARPNFAILKVEVKAIDWLHLANDGHRRARLLFRDGHWQGCWLIP